MLFNILSMNRTRFVQQQEAHIALDWSIMISHSNLYGNLALSALETKVSQFPENMNQSHKIPRRYAATRIP